MASVGNYRTFVVKSLEFTNNIHTFGFAELKNGSSRRSDLLVRIWWRKQALILGRMLTYKDLRDKVHEDRSSLGKLEKKESIVVEQVPGLSDFQE